LNFVLVLLLEARQISTMASSSLSALPDHYYSYYSWFLQFVGLSQQQQTQQHTVISMDFIFRIFVAVLAMFLGYYLVRQKRQSRQLLADELQLAQANIQYLQAKLLTLGDHHSNKNSSQDIRIFMDGAFDLMHYGHMNAFRLAKSLGTHLVVGVNSDESITQCKGEPLMKDHERLTMVQSCKFVDEVVPGCPYIMNKR
jgi:cytidyltransferase-like protein